MWVWGAARLEGTWGLLEDYIPYIAVKCGSATDLIRHRHVIFDGRTAIVRMHSTI